MKKRIVSLFLAVLMVLTASVTVFASDEHDDLTVGASVKVSVAGKNGYTDSAMAVVSDPAEAKYDFVCTLDMSVVNAKFKVFTVTIIPRFRTARYTARNAGYKSGSPPVSSKNSVPASRSFSASAVHASAVCRRLIFSCSVLFIRT